MARIETLPVRIGGSLIIGAGHPVVIQTMCNTHTSDVEATVAQTLQLAAAGAQMVRITVPGRQDVPHVAEIKRRLREAGCRVPLVADIHFSSETAIAVAPVVEKVRIVSKPASAPQLVATTEPVGTDAADTPACTSVQCDGINYASLALN